MLIDSDADSENIPNLTGYLMRPLSPSLSISVLEKSDFSFGGLLEIDEIISEIEKSESKSSSEVYEKKIEEICKQIKILQDLYTKEVVEHENERKIFEEIVKNLRKNKQDEYERKFQSQQMTLLNLTKRVRSLQDDLKSIMRKK